MSNEEMIQQIYNEVINRNSFLERELEIVRREKDQLQYQNQILLDIINNKLNRGDNVC